MNLKPEELSENGYVLIDKLGHNELVPFIQIYMKKRTMYARIYYLCNIFLFGLAGYYFMEGYNLPGYSIGDRFTVFSYGLAIALALLPLHEIDIKNNHGLLSTNHNDYFLSKIPSDL